MIKYILYALFVSLTLSACGGARSSNNADYPTQTVYTVASDSLISWQPPTTHEDNSPLPISGIGGYKVFVGATSSSMRLNTTISDSSITEFYLANLGKGIRHIAFSCFSSNGSESRLSQVIIINII